MADNVELSAGSGGAIIAADDIGPGVWHQRVKIQHGADGSATDVSAASPLPVIGASNSGVDIGDVTINNGIGGSAVPIQDGGNSITVDGTVDLGATDNAVLDSIDAATTAIQAAVEGTLTVASHNVTNAGTFAVQADTELTTDNLDTGAGTDTRAVVGLVGSASGGGELIPGSATDGLLVNLGSNNDVTITGTVDLGATDNAVLDDIAAKLATIDADTSALFGTVGGTELQVDIVSSAAIPVTDNSGSLTVDNAGTFAVQAASAGVAAHDAAISGNPVRIAGRALTSDYAAVAAGDTADLITTLLGKLVNYPYALPGSSWSYAAASGGITNTTGVTAKAAAGAGVRNYITRCQVINGHATVSTDVQIRDGASGTVLWRGFAQAAGGGVTAVFDPPLRGSANTLVEVACGTTGSATYFNLQGFTAAE